MGVRCCFVKQMQYFMPKGKCSLEGLPNEGAILEHLSTEIQWDIFTVNHTCRESWEDLLILPVMKLIVSKCFFTSVKILTKYHILKNNGIIFFTFSFPFMSVPGNNIYQMNCTCLCLSL